MASTSTLQGLTGLSSARRGHYVRRVGGAVLALVVIVGLAGVFGPHRTTKTSTEAGYELTLEYGSIVRSGQPGPLMLTIRHAGGFGTTPVTVVFDKDVFERFDFQNWYPNPDSETGEGATVVYEFTPPEGDTFHVSFDARVGPGQLGGRQTYWVAMDIQGSEINRIEYDVWVMP